MVSSLDSLPSDILQHIALQATINSHPASGTGVIVSLLLTCSTLYHALCIKSCPHLYADIFRIIFDTRAITRTFRFQVTDSQLASELVVRFQMLRRMRERTFSISELHKDLWTALWMIYESDGRNESHLQNVYISEYLLDIIKYWDIKEEGPGHQLRSLVIWILSLTLTQQRILSLTANTKTSLQQFLLPHSGNVHELIQAAANTLDSVSAHLSHVPSRGQGGVGTNDVHSEFFPSTNNEYLIQTQWNYKHGANYIIKYGREWHLTSPDPAPAAISLLFCLKEIDPISIPDHLPETRSIALASQRFGPTKEDLRKIRGYKTKLFADAASLDCHCTDAGQRKYGNRREGQESDFRRILSGQEGTVKVEAPSTMLGKMIGAWEGFYMLAPSTEAAVLTSGSIGQKRRHHAPADFVCRKPMQLVLVEYACFAEANSDFPVVNDESDLKKLSQLFSEPDAGFELDGRKYERLTFDPDPHQGAYEGKATREPVDIVLLGKTMEDHEQAWGGFRFSGRIRKDGSILLKRKAKEDGDDTSAGTWILEGKLCFGTVLVGTCSPSMTTTNHSSPIRGVFSMQKRAKDFTSW